MNELGSFNLDISVWIHEAFSSEMFHKQLLRVGKACKTLAHERGKSIS